MIDFTLFPEHQALQDMYRKFAEERVKPLAREMDEAEKYDMDLLEEMKECGFFGIPFDEKYGGAGSDVLYVLCMEEMSKVDASTGITLSVHTSLCASSINEFGTEEQKQKWLRPLADGTKIGGGLTVSPNIPRMGIHAASNAAVSYQDVRIPAENLLGGVEGKGFKIAMKALDGGRIGIAAQSVGIAQGALNEAIRYVKERIQLGRPIAAFQNTQLKLAEMQTMIDAARLMTYRVAVAKDQDQPYSVYAAMAKLTASDVANQVTRGCVQLLGGYGYAREYSVERMMRDATITEIYEGTSEVMKIVISGSLNLK